MGFWQNSEVVGRDGMHAAPGAMEVHNLCEWVGNGYYEGMTLDNKPLYVKSANGDLWKAPATAAPAAGGGPAPPTRGCFNGYPWTSSTPCCACYPCPNETGAPGSRTPGEPGDPARPATVPPPRGVSKKAAPEHIECERNGSIVHACGVRQCCDV
eukprot:gene16053-16723_t